MPSSSLVCRKSWALTFMVNDEHGADRPPGRRAGLGRPRQPVLLDRPPERHRRLLGDADPAVRRPGLVRRLHGVRDGGVWQPRCGQGRLGPLRRLAPGEMDRITVCCEDHGKGRCAAALMAAGRRAADPRTSGRSPPLGGSASGRAGWPAASPARSGAVWPSPVSATSGRSARAAAAATTMVAIRKPGRSHATSSAQASASSYRAGDEMRRRRSRCAW